MIHTFKYLSASPVSLLQAYVSAFSVTLHWLPFYILVY